MARRCFGEAALPQVDIDARTLARWIKEHSPSTINARDLRRAGALSTKDAARYDAAIAELESGGWLRPCPGRAGESVGRKRKDWDVNPQINGDQNG
jgi:hypothetical protein